MNRKKALWPLMLVLAFALGVLTAQVQAGDLFLSLVRGASAPQETPTPPPSGTVRVASVHWHAERGDFYGELVNETGYTVRVAGVTVRLWDADGVLVRSGTRGPMDPIMQPGERIPFRVWWYDNVPAWASYVVEVYWDPIERLTIERVVLTEDFPDQWQVTATVRNQLPVRVQALAVGIVLYGPNRQVIGYDDPWEFLGPLMPGDTLTVTHTFGFWDWDTRIEPWDCAAFAVPYGCAP